MKGDAVHALRVLCVGQADGYCLQKVWL